VDIFLFAIHSSVQKVLLGEEFEGWKQETQKIHLQLREVRSKTVEISLDRAARPSERSAEQSKTQSLTERLGTQFDQFESNSSCSWLNKTQFEPLSHIDPTF
jgi:hypothetical protein